MNAWSNIQISSQDPEIIQIDHLEKKLGKLPNKVHQIRELITRFEVCHFKYRQHLGKIRDSIIELVPKVDTTRIGINHIQHGEQVLKKDTSGKSLIGQQYVWALKEWLNDNARSDLSNTYDKKLGQEIQRWLGEKNPDKIRLVRLLTARLTWDWKSYEELQQGGKFKDIEFQASRVDICHYAFPQNLKLLLNGIGDMKAVEEKKFEGCGSYNPEIKAYLEKELLDLNDSLKSFHVNKRLDKDVLMKIWLTACLAKTIKESIKISIPIAGL